MNAYLVVVVDHIEQIEGLIEELQFRERESVIYVTHEHATSFVTLLQNAFNLTIDTATNIWTARGLLDLFEKQSESVTYWYEKTEEVLFWDSVTIQRRVEESFEDLVYTIVRWLELSEGNYVAFVKRAQGNR